MSESTSEYLYYNDTISDLVNLICKKIINTEETEYETNDLIMKSKSLKEEDIKEILENEIEGYIKKYMLKHKIPYFPWRKYNFTENIAKWDVIPDSYFMQIFSLIIILSHKYMEYKMYRAKHCDYFDIVGSMSNLFRGANVNFKINYDEKLKDIFNKQLVVINNSVTRRSDYPDFVTYF